NVGIVRAPAIPLEGDRTAATRARPEHPGADCGAHHRDAAWPHAVRARAAPSAGALWILDRVSVPNPANADGSGHFMDPRQHWPLFLAAHEGVLQMGRAVPPGRGDPGADAGAARHLPE